MAHGATNREVVEEYAAASARNDLEALGRLRHPQWTVQWPQSGEVIRGKHKIRELREAYPTPPKATLRRIVGSGDLWAIEMGFDYKKISWAPVDNAEHLPLPHRPQPGS